MPTECQDLAVYNLFLQEGRFSQRNGFVNFDIRQILQTTGCSLASSRIFSGPHEENFFFNVEGDRSAWFKHPLVRQVDRTVRSWIYLNLLGAAPI